MATDLYDVSFKSDTNTDSKSDSTSVKNPYLHKAIEILDEAKKLYRELTLNIRKDNIMWEHVLTKKDSKLYRRERKEISPIPCFLVETTIKQPKAELVKNVWDVNEKLAMKNDPSLVMWREIEKFPTWKVCSQYNGMTRPVWDRHLIFTQAKIEEGDETYLVAHSIDHPKVKVNPKQHVHGHIHMSVYGFRDNHDGSTNVWRVAQVDPRGWLPVWLIDRHSGNLVDMFNRWKEE